MKKLILLALLIVAFVCAWGLMSADVSITLNGQEINGPIAALAGGWGLVITTVVLFCVGILLAFVLAGIGLIVLGVIALAAFILLATLFPFLLPLLIPLFIVLAVCSASRKSQGR